MTVLEGIIIERAKKQHEEGTVNYIQIDESLEHYFRPDSQYMTADMLPSREFRDVTDALMQDQNNLLCWQDGDTLTVKLKPGVVQDSLKHVPKYEIDDQLELNRDHRGRYGKLADAMEKIVKNKYPIWSAMLPAFKVNSILSELSTALAGLIKAKDLQSLRLAEAQADIAYDNAPDYSKQP